jgi:hypothetical protein
MWLTHKNDVFDMKLIILDASAGGDREDDDGWIQSFQFSNFEKNGLYSLVSDPSPHVVIFGNQGKIILIAYSIVYSNSTFFL